MERTKRHGEVAEVARYFLRLGSIAFGGPAVHVAIMRRELVAGRRWVDEQRFADLLGLTSLIPGPNSSEMAMQLGAARAGWRGLWLGGICFIAPAVVLVFGLAWAYQRWGSTAPGEALIWGIQPVMLVVIFEAAWSLRGAVTKARRTFAAAAVAACAWALGAGEGPAIVLGGLAVVSMAAAERWRAAAGPLHAVVPLAFMADASQPRLWDLFLVFLKIGALLYGSGYVLVAFLDSELVDSRMWLSERQLVDAIAAGQVTPGPLFSSATFAGYLVRGPAGAAVATLGIFLPSFLFVTAIRPVAGRARRWWWSVAFLDGVNAGAVVLIAAAGALVAQEVTETPWRLVIFGAALVWVAVRRPGTLALVMAGGGVALARLVVLSL